jgi:fatty-acyl-CoA synthase
MPDVILFVEELPHTATGKLLKINLRQQYENYFLQQEPA